MPLAHRREAWCLRAAPTAPPGLAPPHGLTRRQPSQKAAPHCVGCTARSVQHRAHSQLLPPARTAAVPRALAAREAQRAAGWRHRGLAARSGGGARRRGATRQRRRCTDDSQSSVALAPGKGGSQRTHHVSAASTPNRSAPGSAPRRTLVARSSSTAGAAGRLPGRGGSSDAGRASSSSAAALPRFAASANGAEGALGPALFSVGATKLFKQNVSASGARPAGGGSAGATERRRDPPYMAPERARGVRTFEFGNFTRSLLMSCCFSYGRRAVER